MPKSPRPTAIGIARLNPVKGRVRPEEAEAVVGVCELVLVAAGLDDALLDEALLDDPAGGAEGEAEVDGAGDVEVVEVVEFSGSMYC